MHLPIWVSPPLQLYPSETSWSPAQPLSRSAVCFFPCITLKAKSVLKVHVENTHRKLWIFLHGSPVPFLYCHIVVAAKFVVANWNSGGWEDITERNTLEVLPGITQFRKAYKPRLFISVWIFANKEWAYLSKIELYKNPNSSPCAFVNHCVLS